MLKTIDQWATKKIEKRFMDHRNLISFFIERISMYANIGSDEFPEDIRDEFITEEHFAKKIAVFTSLILLSAVLVWYYVSHDIFRIDNIGSHISFTIFSMVVAMAVYAAVFVYFLAIEESLFVAKVKEREDTEAIEPILHSLMQQKADKEVLICAIRRYMKLKELRDEELDELKEECGCSGNKITPYDYVAEGVAFDPDDDYDDPDEEEAEKKEEEMCEDIELVEKELFFRFVLLRHLYFCEKELRKNKVKDVMQEFACNTGDDGNKEEIE